MVSVSALVSAYHAHKFLEKRLLNLSEHDCEVVAVYQSGSMEERICQDFPVVHVQTPDIPTIYAAWNMAISVASGRYLVSANTDDLFYPGALAKMEAEMDAGAAVVFADSDRLKYGVTYRWKRLDKFSVRELRQRCYIGSMPMWSRSLHDKYGLFDDTFRIAGDWEFWLRIAEAGEKFVYIPRALGLYNDRPGSLEHANQERHRAEIARIRERYG